MNKNLIIIIAGCLALPSGFFVFQSQKADFKTIDGASWSWNQLQGEWVVINYFAEWCAPCLKEVPELNQFYNQSDIKLFAISFDAESDEKMRQIKSKYSMQFPIISAESDSNLPLEKPNALPATYIIDNNGQVKKRLMGEQTHTSLMAAIQALKGL